LHLFLLDTMEYWPAPVRRTAKLKQIVLYRKNQP
jgi:hypothetical protein